MSLSAKPDVFTGLRASKRTSQTTLHAVVLEIVEVVKTKTIMNLMTHAFLYKVLYTELENKKNNRTGTQVHMYRVLLFKRFQYLRKAVIKR